MNDRERVSIPEVLGEVPDRVEAESKASAEQPTEAVDSTLGGLWQRDDPDNADLDDTVRNHLGKPADKWQMRPVPWEYTSKARYRHDLEKFMEEVYGNGND